MRATARAATKRKKSHKLDQNPTDMGVQIMEKGALAVGFVPYIGLVTKQILNVFIGARKKTIKREAIEDEERALKLEKIGKKALGLKPPPPFPHPRGLMATLLGLLIPNASEDMELIWGIRLKPPLAFVIRMLFMVLTITVVLLLIMLFIIIINNSPAYKLLKFLS